MKDVEGVAFLQWCLPNLHMRWPGFRKVRRQVYKRIDRRLKDLGLANISAYREYLETHSAEWSLLDTLCRISISRFYRDKGVFEFLEREVLPELTQVAVTNGENEVRCWSIGCASGEEPYTLAILWKFSLAFQFPALSFHIVATDADQQAIERARMARYPASSLKDLPGQWRAQAFTSTSKGFSLKAEYRESVTFLEQDIRVITPDNQFHLVLCRNVAFTYFDDTLQRETLNTIRRRLIPTGVLVLGSLESLPQKVSGFEPWAPRLGIYRQIEKWGKNRGNGQLPFGVDRPSSA